MVGEIPEPTLMLDYANYYDEQGYHQLDVVPVSVDQYVIRTATSVSSLNITFSNDPRDLESEQEIYSDIFVSNLQPEAVNTINVTVYDPTHTRKEDYTILVYNGIGLNLSDYELTFDPNPGLTQDSDLHWSYASFEETSVILHPVAPNGKKISGVYGVYGEPIPELPGSPGNYAVEWTEPGQYKEAYVVVRTTTERTSLPTKILINPSITN